MTTPTPEAAGTETVIAEKRRRIDDLDTRIIDLVRERMTVSGQIQHERIGAGGRRVSLNREMEVLTHYSAELGRPGTTLAMTLLELCRGKV
ncbi:chorismate mutase [Actinacidiphila alni]|uniref:Chorismate mutase n=1 Tax=Actinacidiphila alni TaxID=380248 RepID=A0A1I2DJ37_9ACTN|nr:chorismate mutase [Actinacidiphila alni]SFE80672.1 chorismate mutase [Actinacidiphila alni]